MGGDDYSTEEVLTTAGYNHAAGDVEAHNRAAPAKDFVDLFVECFKQSLQSRVPGPWYLEYVVLVFLAIGIAATLRDGLPLLAPYIL